MLKFLTASNIVLMENARNALQELLFPKITSYVSNAETDAKPAMLNFLNNAELVLKANILKMASVTFAAEDAQHVLRPMIALPV